MRDLIWHLSVIGLIGGAIFFTNLGQARLWDRDEPRNAGCAAEMLARGDWVVPTFNGELRHQKPVLLYWLIMSAYSVFGVNEFSARFWSAVLAMVTTYATYGIARRMVSPAVGLLAAIALASSLMFDVAARAATPDSVLVCCSTVAIYLYVVGTFGKSGTGNFWFPQNIYLTTLMYAVMGCGVLAKGPVGFFLPMAIIGMFMLIARLEKQSKRLATAAIQDRFIDWIKRAVRPFYPMHFLKTFWTMRPLLAAAIVLIVAAPWYFMVAEATRGVFIEKFFVGEHFGRATVAMENHSGGFWFYPVAILVGFFPWSVLWGPVAVNLLFGERLSTDSGRQKSDLCPEVETNWPIALMLCWVGVQVGVFSLAQTKLPSYITPCYPALAILAAICLNDLSSGRARINRGWFHAAFAGLALSGAAMIGVIGFAASRNMPNQIWLALLGVVPLTAGCVMMVLLAKGKQKMIPVWFASCGVLFCWLLFGFGPQSLDSEQESHLVLGEIVESDSAVASFGCLESSWVFYCGQPIVEFAAGDEHLKYESEELNGGKFSLASTGVANNPAADSSTSSSVNNVVSQSRSKRAYWEPREPTSLEYFVRENEGAVVLTTSDHLDELKKRLPKDYEVIREAKYFLKNKKIFLVGPRVSVGDSNRTYY